jgi:hypothetical protein
MTPEMVASQNGDEEVAAELLRDLVESKTWDVKKQERGEEQEKILKRDELAPPYVTHQTMATRSICLSNLTEYPHRIEHGFFASDEPGFSLEKSRCPLHLLLNRTPTRLGYRRSSLVTPQLEPLQRRIRYPRLV